MNITDGENTCRIKSVSEREGGRDRERGMKGQSTCSLCLSFLLSCGSPQRRCVLYFVFNLDVTASGFLAIPRTWNETNQVASVRTPLLSERSRRLWCESDHNRKKANLHRINRAARKHLPLQLWLRSLVEKHLTSTSRRMIILRYMNSEAPSSSQMCQDFK